MTARKRHRPNPRTGNNLTATGRKLEVVWYAGRFGGVTFALAPLLAVMDEMAPGHQLRESIATIEAIQTDYELVDLGVQKAVDGGFGITSGSSVSLRS